MTDYVAELRKKRQTESVLKSIGTAERLAQQQQSVLQSIQSDSAARKSFNEYTANTRYGFGNVDLTNRPKYYNDDGSVSTVRSMSFYDEDEAREILVPTVASVGGTVRLLSDDEARARYYATGEHLGKFNTPEQATEYAMALHNAQQAQVERQRARTSFDFDEDEGTYRWNGKTYASREELTRAMNAAGLSAEEQTSVARKAQSSGSGVVLHNNRFMSTEEQAQAIERERLASIDLTAQQKKLDELKAQLRTEKAKSAGGRTGRHRTDADRAAQDRIAADIRTLEHEMIQAETVQKADDFYRVWQKQDFDATARKGGAKAGNLVMRARRGQAKNLQEAESNDYRYTLMNDDEVRTYNYYFETDEKKAGEYLKFLEEELNRRQGVVQGEAVRGIENAAGRAAMTVAYGIGAGLDQFASGTRQFFSSDRLPTSAAQFGSAYIREDLGDVGAKLPDWLAGATAAQVGYDALTTGANMAPSILLASLTGGIGGAIGGAAGAAISGAAGTVGAVSMGTAAAGNAYNQALAEGKTKREARLYSTMIGLSEAFLQETVGGIVQFGGTLANVPRLRMAINNMDSALLRTASNLGVNMLFEGLEEYAQDILEPVFRNLFYGEHNDTPLWTEDAMYSFLLGAITAGFLDAPQTISNGVSINRMGAQIAGNHLSDNLVEVALRLDPETEAYHTAQDIRSGKLRKNTHNIGELFLQYAGAGGDLSVFDAGIDRRGRIVTDAGTGGEAYARMQGIVNARENGYTETGRLDAVASEYLNLDMGQGSHMGLETARRNADIVIRYMNGETITPQEVKRLNLTQRNTRALFEEFTGVELPEDFNKLSPKAQIETVLALQQNIPTLQPKEVYEATATPDLNRVSPVDRSTLQENVAPTQTQDGLTIDGFAQLYRATVNADADDAEIMSEFQKFLGTLPGAEGLGENEAAAWRMVRQQNLDGVTIRMNGQDVGFEEFRRMAMQQPGADQVTMSELREAFLDISRAQGRIDDATYNELMGGMDNGRNGVHDAGLPGQPGERTGEQAGRVDGTAGGAEGESAGAEGAVQAEREGDGTVRQGDERSTRAGAQAEAVRELDLTTEDVAQRGKNREPMKVVAEADRERVFEAIPALRKLDEDVRRYGGKLTMLLGGIDTGKTRADGSKVYADGMFRERSREVTVQLDSEHFAAENLGGHELAHLRYLADNAYRVLSDGFAAGLRGTEIEDFVRENYDTKGGPYTPIYGLYAEKNATDFFQELLADLSGNVNRQAMDAAKFAALRERYLKAVEALDAQQTAAQAAETAGTPEGRYSIDSMAEAVGLTFEKDGQVTVLKDSNGKSVDRVTEEMVEKSPLGATIQAGVDGGYLTEEKAKEQRGFFAGLYNLFLDTQDIDLIWATSSATGFQPIESGPREVPKIGKSKSRFSGYTANSDPQYSSTVDFTTICLKTQAVIDAMSETMKKLGHGLTEDEIVNVVYRNTHEAGEPVPCPVCYVFSRWVGLGGLFDNMKMLQARYENADEGLIRRDMAKLEKEIDKIADERGIRGGKARQVLLKTVQTEYNALQDKVTLGKIQGKDLLSAAEHKQLDKLEQELSYLNNWSWLQDVRLSENYTPVPDDVLFDINAGKTFAEDYPESWAYRVSRGPGMGKAATPYADAHLGQIMRGAGMDKKSLNKLGDNTKNPFLNTSAQNGTLNRTARAALDKSRKAVKRQNLLNGQRFQSTSDFRFEYALDYLLAFTEMQTLGSKVQLYTKVPEAVPMFASVGAETNCSLMPLGVGVATDENGNRVLVFSYVTGMAPEDAFRLSNTYDNVQPILVTVTDEHTKLAMADPRITFIIPYHASGASEGRYAALMDVVGESIDRRDDYTNYQTDHENLQATPEQKAARDVRYRLLIGELGSPTAEEREIVRGNPILNELYKRFYGTDVDGKQSPIDPRYLPPESRAENNTYRDPECYGSFLKKDQAEHIMPFEYWDRTSTIEDADAQGKAFADYCESLGLHPRFSGWDAKGNYNAEKDFTRVPGYWKTLGDRRLYNRDGTYHEQKAIDVTNFDADYLFRDKASEGVTKPSRANNPALTQEIAEKSAREIARSRGERYSVATDSTGRELTLEQQAYFAESKVRDDEGHLVPVYHGTPAGGFNTFQMPQFLSKLMSSYGGGFYFTTNKLQAEQYTKAINKSKPKGARKKVYEVYLNITNPLELNGLDREIKITPDQLRELVKRGDREWFKTNGMAFDAHVSKEDAAKMSFDELVDAYVDYQFKHAYYTEDILSELVAAYNGGSNALLDAMHDVLGYDGVKYTYYPDNIFYVAWAQNQIKNVNNLNPTEDTDIRYSVAGWSADKADMNTMWDAQQMDQRGEDMKDIWRTTGWWKGKDGKWRFEIDDSQMTFHPEKFRGKKQMELQDVLDHDLLYQNYPMLRHVKVDMNLPTSKAADGQHRKGEISLKAGLSPEETSKALIHEIQHEIQDIENFAKGANAEVAYRDLFVDTVSDIWKNDPATAQSISKLKTYAGRINRIEREMAKREVQKSDPSLPFEYRMFGAMFDRYQSAIGEQEARSTADRLNMDAAQRATEAPYLAQDGLLADENTSLQTKLKFYRLHKALGAPVTKDGKVKVDKIARRGYDLIRNSWGWGNGQLDLNQDFDRREQGALGNSIGEAFDIGGAEEYASRDTSGPDEVPLVTDLQGLSGLIRDALQQNTNAEASAVAGASSMPEIAPDAAVERYEQATPVQKRAMTRSDLAYMERNPNSYRDSSSGEDVRYSVSPDAQDNFHPLRDENGEIKYVYKAFYARDGKLYPPMVSNISDVKNAVSKPVSGTMRGLDTPVGIVLTADVGKLGRGAEGELIRNSRGRLVVVNDKGGGTLAFRPGWHLGEWPDAKQFNKNSPLGPRTVMPDALVFAKCEIAGDVDYQLQAMSLGVKENGKYDRTQAGLPRIPTNGYYKYRTNPDPQTAPWYITGAMRIVEILDDADCAEICAQYGVTPSPRESGKPIRLEDYGLKRGPVTAVADITPYAKNEAAMTNEQELWQALNDPAYADAYVGRTINFDDPEIIAELKRNRQDIDRYRALAEGGDYTNWRGEEERFSVADKDYNKTALLQESTVDRYLKDYAAPSSPNYAQAYIAWMSPKDFLDLTTTRQGRARIESETTPLDVEGLGEATQHQPFQLRIDHETGEINGHEGRHRANALLRAGVERIPVLMFDSSNKYSKAPISELVLKGQDFGNNRSTAEVTARDLIPLNYANRDEIIKAFGTQPTLERMNEQYNGAETVRYSVSPETEAKYDAAVSSDNMDEAQRLVDEAAKSAGYDTPKLYHGTRAFGFTAFDPSRSDDGISLFATDNPRTAETYSGETKRSRIKDAATVNTDNLRGEQLLAEAQKNLKKYEDYGLMTDAQKREQIAEKRDDIALARQDAVNFIRDHDGAFDAEKMEVMNRILRSLTELTTAENEDELWEAWNNYDSAIWDLKFMDESLTQEFLESIGYRQLQVHKNQLNDFMYDGDIFIRDDGPYAFSYVFDNQLALELGAELHKGVYELYGKPGRQLVIDTEGANWNQIKPPDELNLYGPQRTRDIATAAKANGYDSVLFKNLRDNGGETGYNGESNVYIFFNPEDLKSADPVTYDMGGNVIPLSKRFDSRDDDIRYSVSPELKQWFELQKQYGTMPESRGSVRAAEVPQRTEKNNRVSRTAATVMGAQATPEGRIDTIAQAVVDGKLSYEPLPNKVAANKARNQLRLRGWSESVREWKNAVDEGRSGADLVAMGATLLNNAGNSEATGEEYVDLLTTYSDLLRRSGQAVQAAKILQKLTPEAKLYGIQKTVDKMNRKAMEKAQPGDFDPTTGEFNGIQLDPGLVEEYNHAQTDEERNEIIERMAKDVASKTKTTAWDRLTAWRYLNMLGNFRTQVRNVLGNAGFQPVRMLKDSVVGLTEAMLQRAGVKIDRSSSVLRDAATWRAAGQVFKEYQDAILAGGKYQDDTGLDFAGMVNDNRRIFGNTKYKAWNRTVGAVLEGYRKSTNTAMDVGDAVFCSFTFRDSLARFMAANKTTWNTASEELRTRAVNKAIRDAAEATYRDNNEIAAFLSRAARSDTTPAIFKVLGEGVMPFRKTPANILMRSYEYSPLSIIGNTITDIQTATGRKTVSANEIVEQWAKTFTGTGLVALGYALASMGRLIGKAPDDDKENALFEQEGYQAYSLVANGHTFTLDWAAPEAIPLFLGANIAQEGLENGLSLKDGLDAVMAIGDPLFEMSMLQGINDALESVGTYGVQNALVSFVTNAAMNYATQFASSTLVGQAERALQGNTRMQTYVDKNGTLPVELQRQVGKFSAKTPGWDYGQIPYVDAWGDVQENADSQTWNVITQLFSPSYVSRVEHTYTLDELSRLYDATGEASVILDTPNKYFTVNGERKDLTADEYLTYAITRGQTAKRMLADLFASAEYRNLSDAEKVSAVSKVYDYANQQGMAAVSAYEPESWVGKMSAGAQEHGINEATYTSVYTKTKDIVSMKDKNGETVANSKSLQIMAEIYATPGLSDEQVQYLAEALDVGKTVRGYSQKMVERKLAAMHRLYDEYN